MRSSLRFLASTAVLGLSAGCAADGRDMMATGTGVDTTASTSGASAGSDSDGGSDSGGTDGELLDVGAGTGATAGDTGADGCQKIDFLFVIDDSGSMYDFQQNLLQSFPGFIEAIEDTTNVTDHHIMVVDTSVDSEANCVEACDFDTFDISTCSTFIDSCQTLDNRDPCESVLGAGVTTPRGYASSMQDCGLPAPRRYIDGTDDVEAMFSCIAQVGTSGMGEERPYGAMSAALSDQGEVAACNAGFLRDDAILVVTVLSDAGADTTADVPQGANEADLLAQWKDALVKAKPQGDSAVVLLSYHFYEDVAAGAQCPVKVGPGSAFAPDVYHDVPSLLGMQGFEASICLDDYGDAFAGAVGTIAQTCDDFIPPG